MFTSFEGEPSKGKEGIPKVNSRAEILHEKVKKQVIKETHGQKPSKDSTCFLNCKAWIESTQFKFKDTWFERQPFKLELGKENKELKGVTIGVLSMKAGERALLHVGWELGYGKKGNHSSPFVPPMADLVYEVEVISFEKSRNGNANDGVMSMEKRVQAAEERKTEGNAFFKDGKLSEAMQQYEMAISYVGNDTNFQLYREMGLAVKNPCHLNMAACLLKLKRYEEAVVHCGTVLAHDENNVKALFRRGKARAELGQTDAAKEDFLKAQKFAPEDKVIVSELRLLAEDSKAVYQKQKELYKGIFGPRVELETLSKHDNDVLPELSSLTPKVNLIRRSQRPSNYMW
ncbi:hypothetical protein IFM89_006972 [Coptis chinensis]|uniref:peptidylprolyl isomerase n=1 Tax=Coptis chinensis TaxID=261450 RepID=A0A835H983_9MAGN|nr:hypothetical protein IFM89_006972 [Coptis chinensis]